MFPFVDGDCHTTRFLCIMLYRVLDINEFTKASLSLLSCVVGHRDTRFQTPLSARSIGPSAAVEVAETCGLGIIPSAASVVA
jgi:hypothetical protein